MSRLRRRPTSSTRAVRRKANRLRCQKQYREAIVAYSEVIDVRGEGMPLDYHDRGFCHLELDEFESAIRDYSESISLGGISKNLHWTYYNRGVSHWELKQYEEAISDFTESIRLRDDYANAYYYRAVCHLGLNHSEEALSDINEAIRLQPEDGLYFHESGLIKMYCVKDYESALRDFSEAIRLGYVHEYSYRNRGECYRVLHQFDNSLEDLNHSIELNPKIALAYASRGILFQQMNRFEEAIADCEKALQLDGSLAGAATALEEVRQLPPDCGSAVVSVNGVGDDSNGDVSASSVGVVIPSYSCISSSLIPDSDSALHDAIVQDDVDVVRKLLLRHFDIEKQLVIRIEIQGSNRWTLSPLHLAAYHGRVNICQILLKNGALIDAKNGIGLSKTTKATPLHFAVLGEHVAVVRLLLENGADPQLKTSRDACVVGLRQKRPIDFATLEFMKPSSVSSLRGSGETVHPCYGILAKAMGLFSGIIDSELETKREAMRFLKGDEKWENLSSLLESNGSWEARLLEKVNDVAVFRTLVHPLPVARATLVLQDFSGVDPSVVLQALLGDESALLQEPRNLLEYHTFFQCLNLHDEATRVCDLVRMSELDIEILVDLMTAAAEKEKEGKFTGMITTESKFTVACLDALQPHREVLNPNGESLLVAQARSWILSLYAPSSKSEAEEPSTPFPVLAARRLERLNAFRQNEETDDDHVVAAAPLTMKLISCEGKTVGVHAVVMCSKFFQFVGDLRMDSVEVKSGLLLWKSELSIDALEGLASYAYTNDPSKMVPDTEDSSRRFIAILSMLSFLFREVYSHEAAIQHLVSELRSLFYSLSEEDQLHRVLAICGKQVVTSFGVDFLEKLLHCVSGSDDTSALLPYHLPDLVCELMLLENFQSDDRFLNASKCRFCLIRKMEEEVLCCHEPGRLDELKVEILQGCMEMTSEESVDLVRRCLFLEEEEEEEGETETEDRSFLSLKPFVTIDAAELLTLWKSVIQRDEPRSELAQSIQELLEERLGRSLSLLSSSHLKHIVLQNVSLLKTSEASRALLTPYLKESVLDLLICEDLAVVLPLWLRERLAHHENHPFLAALARRVELVARMIGDEGEDFSDGSSVLHRFPNVCSQLIKISQDESNSSLFTPQTIPMICDVFRSFGDISILLDKDLAGLCEFVTPLVGADWSLCGGMSNALDISSSLVGINRLFKLLVALIKLSELGYDAECLRIVETKIIQAPSLQFLFCLKGGLPRRIAACGGVFSKIGLETMRRMFVSTGLLDEDQVARLLDEGLETIVHRLAQFRDDNVVGRFVSLHLTDRLSQTFADKAVDCIELECELVKSCVSVDSETLTLLREAVVSASRDSVIASSVPQILEFVTTDLSVLLSLWHRVYVSGSSVPQALLQSSLYDHISKVIVQEETSEDKVALCVVESTSKWRQTGCVHDLAPAFRQKVDFDRLSNDDLEVLLHLLMDMISDHKLQLVSALEARIRFVAARFCEETESGGEEDETIQGCPYDLALLLLRTIHSDPDFEARVEQEKGRISNLFRDGVKLSVATLVSNSMDCLSSVIVELEIKHGLEDDLVVVMKERLNEATQRLQEDREATTQMIANLYLEQKRMKRRMEDAELRMKSRVEEVVEDAQLRIGVQQEEQQRVNEQLEEMRSLISSQLGMRKQEEE